MKNITMIATLLFVALGFFASDAMAQKVANDKGEVFSAPANMQDEHILRYFDPAEDPLLFSVPDNGGFIFGSNTYGDQGKAVGFNGPAVIESVNLYFGAVSPGFESTELTVSIVGGSIAAGPDMGNEFASTTITLADAQIGDGEALPTNISFGSEVEVDGTFFVVYNWDTALFQEAFGMFSTDYQLEAVAEEWEQWDDGDWYNVSQAWFEEGDDGWYQWIEVITVEQDTELGAFALLSPPDGFSTTVEQGTDDPVVVEWEVSDNAETYTWLVNVAGAGFEDPALELPSDNDGAANTLSLTTGAIYDVLVGLGFEDGDTAELEWTVEAAAGENTLLADAPFSIDITLQGEPTSTEPISNLPQDFNLKQNYPNPFNPTTSIEFSVPEASDVSLEVFNMQGQRVATLVNGSMSAGTHRASFDAANLSSGIYLYRMTAGSFTATNKMMLVK
jgi:hypothetical protein